MRILNNKYKTTTRSSGIVISSKTCFLLLGFWFIGSFFFQQPIQEPLIEAVVEIIPIVPKKIPIFSDMHTFRNLFL